MPHPHPHPHPHVGERGGRNESINMLEPQNASSLSPVFGRMAPDENLETSKKLENRNEALQQTSHTLINQTIHPKEPNKKNS
jgi:hypothetical protein